MKAVVYTRYRGPDVLRLTDADTPVPGDGQVLVKVHEQEEGLLHVVRELVCKLELRQALMSVEASAPPVINTASVFATWRSASRSV